MTHEQLMVYVATYASVDRASDDLACVRRFQHDGIVTPTDSATIARDAGAWVVRRDRIDHPDLLPPRQQTVEWVLGLLFTLSLPPGSSPAGSDRAQAWMLDDEADELREQLALVEAAVVVVGSVAIGPVLRVALARATSLLDVSLTPAGASLVEQPPATAGAHV